MNGVELVSRLRADPDYEHVPIIMIIAERDRDLRLAAIEAGATDFLNKPVDPAELRVRGRNLLSLRKAQLALADRALLLSHEVEIATRQIAEREEDVILRLTRAIEWRDGNTGEHVSRVATISRLIALHLGKSPAYCRVIYLATPLHDIGKIGVPDGILNKPGRLNEEEMAIMRAHTRIGGQIMEDGSSELIRMAEEIARTHHEKWDGSGYPASLRETAIPLSGRIVAVADVFDALCTERPYKRPWSLAEARGEIKDQAGRHFDPACVEAFDPAWMEIAAVFAPTSAHGTMPKTSTAA